MDYDFTEQNRYSLRDVRVTNIEYNAERLIIHYTITVQCKLADWVKLLFSFEVISDV